VEATESDLDDLEGALDGALSILSALPACHRCERQPCPAIPRARQCPDREACALATLAECWGKGLHRACVPGLFCDWANEQGPLVRAAGLASLGPFGLAVVVESPSGEWLGVPHGGRSYATAGPHRTRLGRRAGEPVGMAKSRALIVCAVGHVH